MPYLAEYIATKRYNDHFSKSLLIEYPEIDIMSLRPGLVKTPGTRQHDSWMGISPNQCALGALKDLGKYYQTSSHWRHDFTHWTLDNLPKFILNWTVKMELTSENERYRSVDSSSQSKVSASGKNELYVPFKDEA